VPEEVAAAHPPRVAPLAVSREPHFSPDEAPGRPARLAAWPAAAALWASVALAAQAQPAAAIDQVAWLTGCWVADGGEAGTVEHWLAPAAGTMFGVNRSVRGGRLAQFEFMAIRTAHDGRLVFVALPGGRNATEFAARSLAAAEVVFENPRHDFPNRVIYRRTGERTMLGRIEGQANGEARAVDFPFTRVPCPEAR
jgi:hypothetical protein